MHFYFFPTLFYPILSKKENNKSQPTKLISNPQTGLNLQFENTNPDLNLQDNAEISSIATLLGGHLTLAWMPPVMGTHSLLCSVADPPAVKDSCPFQPVP